MSYYNAVEREVKCWYCDDGCDLCNQTGRIVIYSYPASKRRVHGSVQQVKIRGTRIGPGCYRRGGLAGAE